MSFPLSADAAKPDPVQNETAPLKLQLIKPALWEPILEEYAAATKLALVVTDEYGRPVSRVINPRPTWSQLRARKPVQPGECPFCIRTQTFESCLERSGPRDEDDANPSFTDYAGLVHFVVPLTVGEELVGTILAGQVLNQYPDQLGLETVGKEFGIPSQDLLHIARNEVPVSRATLQVYRKLLQSFASTYLRAELHNQLEAQRLAEMTNLRDLLIQADRRKDEFLATLSHELRTPLTAILGWIRLLRGGRAMDGPTTDKAMEVIDRSAQTQLALIEDLLEVSRIITGKIQIEVQATDFVTVVNAAIDAVRPAADIKRIAIQVTLDVAAGAIMGDAARLQQVVWNLLTNAVKFTPSGGRIEVRLERVNLSARLTISDTGEGISPQFLSSVFDRFLQADSSSARKHGGLGLGLAIVRQLVELHGGTVTASSRGSGQGATFTVTLPLR